MYRSAPLWIILAFILGLWIGMNPQARASAQKAWADADTAAAELGQRFSAGLDGLFNRVSEESPPPSNPPVESKPSNFLGQVEAALEEIWNALVRFWNDLTDGPAPADASPA